MIVLTPKEHKEALSQLTDDELYDLWTSAMSIMRELGISKFNSAILNHGTSRNHAHLHLKARWWLAVCTNCLRRVASLA